MRSLLLLIAVFCPLTAWAQAADEAKKEQARQAALGETIDLEVNEFKNESRLGLIFTTGNTGSVAISGNNTTKYRIRRFENTINAGAHYNRITSTTGTTGTGTTARYIYGTYRLDYYLLPKMTVYGGGGGYTDRIKGIDVAGQGFTGVTYYFFRQKNLDLGASLGYDFTFEDRLPPTGDQGIHSAAAGLVYRQDLNDLVTISEKIEALDDVQRGRDFRLQSRSDLKVKMTTHLALGVGFHLRFDNVPVPGFKKLDTLSDVSLVVSF